MTEKEYWENTKTHEIKVNREIGLRLWNSVITCLFFQPEFSGNLYDWLIIEVDNTIGKNGKEKLTRRVTNIENIYDENQKIIGSILTLSR